MDVKVTDLAAEGYVECPRCRLWHDNLLNPMAVTSRKKGKGFDAPVVETTSQVCDRCCDTLLEAFADPDWQKYWPEVTVEEAETIVVRINEARAKNASL
jgi:hypothetical protein